jgi:hypothetical protein
LYGEDNSKIILSHCVKNKIYVHDGIYQLILAPRGHSLSKKAGKDTFWFFVNSIPFYQTENIYRKIFNP